MNVRNQLKNQIMKPKPRGKSKCQKKTTENRTAEPNEMKQRKINQNNKKMWLRKFVWVKNYDFLNLFLFHQLINSLITK